MAIDRRDVEGIATLARLHIAEGDKDRLAAQLSAVLDYAAALQKLDLEGCEPTHFAPAGTPLRGDDEDDRRLKTAEALAQAPEGEDGFFLVPPIVEHLAP